jgi:predicted lipoprotein with Yx(FWY)xxD motif
MKRTRLSLTLVVLAVAVAAIALVAGGSAKTPAAGRANSAISLKQTSFGEVLTDAQGRTLYLFEGDRRSVSTLSAAGRAVWPPFTAAAALPRAAGGVPASAVARVAGATGGRTQISYNGHPLYYYVGDHTPGQTRGQGLKEFGARWYVVNRTGKAVLSAPPTPPVTNGSGSAYTY